MPKVLGGGAFGKWLAHDGGGCMAGISVLIKEAPERSFAPSARWGHEMLVCNPEVGALQNLTLLVPWAQTSSLQNCEK